MGTYHDPMRDKCRRVPGGGDMIKINFDATCSGGFVGLLAHSRKSRYYYVCNKDSVLTCMCKSDELFSKIRLKCENKERKSEKFTHRVVENIFEKYKCTMMQGSYEDGKCLLDKSCDSQMSIDSNQTSENQSVSALKLIFFIRKA
jgi:hypothetical protein